MWWIGYAGSHKDRERKRNKRDREKASKGQTECKNVFEPRTHQLDSLETVMNTKLQWQQFRPTRECLNLEILMEILHCFPLLSVGHLFIHSSLDWNWSLGVAYGWTRQQTMPTIHSSLRLLWAGPLHSFTFVSHFFLYLLQYRVSPKVHWKTILDQLEVGLSWWPWCVQSLVLCSLFYQDLVLECIVSSPYGHAE